MQRALLVLMALAFLAVAGCERDSDAAAAKPVPAAAVARPEPAPTPSPAPARAQPTQAEPACGGEHGGGGECAGGCDQWNEAAGAVIARDVPADAVWTTLKVTGMRCSGCEQRIIANVGSIDGVLAVEADAELGQVRVAMAKGKDLLEQQAADRINSLGYRAE